MRTRQPPSTRRSRTLPADLMPVSCYCHAMAHLQVKNVPDSLHGRLRCFARETNRTLSAAVLAAVKRELEAWEWRKRLAERSETELGVDVATLIAEARALRERELESN